MPDSFLGTNVSYRQKSLSPYEIVFCELRKESISNAEVTPDKNDTSTLPL